MSEDRGLAHQYDDPKLKARAWALRDEGLAYQTIAFQLGVSVKTVSKWLKTHQRFTPKESFQMEELSPIPLADLRGGCPRCTGPMIMSGDGDEVGCLICGHYVYNIAPPVDLSPAQKLNGFNGRITPIPPYQPRDARSANTENSVLVEAVNIPNKGRGNHKAYKTQYMAFRVYCPYDREEMNYAADGDLDDLIDKKGDWHTALFHCPQGHRITIHPHRTHASWTPTPRGAGIKSEQERAELW